jgi:hypothetical protein
MSLLHLPELRELATDALELFCILSFLFVFLQSYHTLHVKLFVIQLNAILFNYGHLLFFAGDVAPCCEEGALGVLYEEEVGLQVEMVVRF